MQGASSEKGSLTYRADVDGLRAIAVLLVIAAHLRTRFSGGYIGVDVFFVISGYLISTVILKELDSGTFSIVRFYERRIRRIFPAMLIMMAVTTVFVYRFFVPSEVEGFARSVLAALLSSSNFLFRSEANYFDAPSAIKPLLHTWSLAVEEQFYIAFPIFLVFIRRHLPRRLKQAVIGLTFLSLVAAVVTVRKDPTAAFFFAPLRAWELLVGMIVSQRYIPAIRNNVLRNASSALGLLMILVPAVIYGPTTPFPGLAAIPPCLGAALIIAAGDNGPTLVGRFLSTPPVVFIGLISYSLYLWHWPILVFQNTSSIFVSGVVAKASAKLLIISVSLIIATLSWTLIEQPFRKGRFRPNQRTVFVVNGAGVAVLAIAAISMISMNGFPNRFSPEAQKIAAFSGRTLDEPSFREADCFVGDKHTYADYKPQICLQQSPRSASVTTVLLLGDSHALHLYPGLAAEFPQFDILQATSAGCVPPLKSYSQGLSGCEELGKLIFGDFLLHSHVDMILMSGRWERAQFPQIQATIDFAHQNGIAIAIVGPSIEYDTPLPRLLAISMRDNKLGEVEMHRYLGPERLDQVMSMQARDVWHVPYISVYQDLCNPLCPVLAAPGAPLLLDADHFSLDGSMRLAKVIRERKQLQPPAFVPRVSSSAAFSLAPRSRQLP